MATWKKVLVEDANIQVGDITATLGNVTGIGDANLTVNLVTSTTDGTTSGDLGVASVTFGTAAFDDASSFATAAQGGLADTALQTANFAADIIAGSTGGIAVTDGNNKVLGADSADISLDLDISSITTTITSVSSTDLIPLQDADDNATKKASVANIIAAVSSGVTTFNAGRNLTEADNETEGTIDLDLDINLVDVNSVQAEGAEDGVDTDTGGTNLLLKGGASTGNVGGGEIQLRVTPAGGASGTALNNHALAVQVNPDRTTQFYNQIILSNSTSNVGFNVGNKDIINVGDISLDSISADANDIVFSLTDNRLAALDIKEGANSYLKFVTTNGGEKIVAGKDVTIEGNLTVNGDTTTVSSSNLLVEDQFIYLNDSGAGANVDRDGGFVVEGLTKSVAFGYHQTDDRFVFDKTGATSNMTDIDPDAYFIHVHTAAGDATNADTDFAQVGNMYINSSTQDIYIYS